MAKNKPADYTVLSENEWLVTNGMGSYASSTVIGANTRRYHGLLVASLNPPTERKVMVSKVDETIFSDNKEFLLSTNHYKDTVFPEGFKHIAGFERAPLPVTKFKAGKAELQKMIFMVYNSNTTVIEYTNISDIDYTLRLNPLYVNRDFHALFHEQADKDFYYERNNTQFVIYAYYGAEALYLNAGNGNFTEHRDWFKDLNYEIDKERGQGHLEDSHSIGYLEYHMEPGQTIHLIFSLEEEMIRRDPSKLKEEELRRLSQLVPGSVKNKFLADLIVSGDQFLVRRRSTDNYSIIAGYHWFSDWGRDAMIAVRGLCIATGKQAEARSIITTFLNYLDQGIIPNRFPDYKNDQPEYHTVDASLWLFIAVYEYDLKFQDKEFLQLVYPKLVQIINFHLTGTKHNIHVLDNGLLYGGTMGLPLTWMDARIRDHIFTPRIGCPVEINALWYNALTIYEYTAQRLEEKPNALYLRIRNKVKEQFPKSFLNEQGHLNDYVTVYRDKDTSIRPNQIYAVSLPFPLLTKEQEKMVVESTEKELLTDFGLRTLAKDHPDFRGTYAGDIWERDTAYHQGTVWPFLIAEYYMAYLKVHNHSEEAKKKVESGLVPLKEHFYKSGCLYGISEIFDGLHPKTGKGCMQQAWSVSNLILLILKYDLKI